MKSPMDYFFMMLPKIINYEGKENLKCMMFLQKSGDMVYVPSGYWYSYIAVEETMSVTQKFVSSANFDQCWKSMRACRKSLSTFFLKTLKTKNEFLYDRAFQ